MLINGFRKELEARLDDISKARVELERLYAMRVDDSVVDAPEHSQFKEDAIKAIRTTDSSLTSFAGSVRSMKSVLETLVCMGQICDKIIWSDVF